MSIFKIFLLSFFVSTTLLMSGCQSTNSDAPANDGGSTTPPPSGGGGVVATKTISLPTSSITITKDNEEVEILVLAFDENNQSLNTGTIIVTYPSEIITGSVDGGRFETQEMAVVNGEAKFKFLGPSKLVGINDLIFQFGYKEDATVPKKNLTVSYTPDIPNLVLPSNEFNLTTNSQSVDIEINVLSSLTNAAYNEGNISVIYPEDIKNGIDVGYFEDTTVDIVNGKATFRYVGPKNLKSLVDENVSSSTFWFYHSSYYNKDNNITFKYNPDPNNVILEDYNITSTLSGTNLSMGLESTKNISFYLKNDTGELVADENVTSIEVKLLNPALGDLKDSAGTVDKNITVSHKNTVGLSLISKTLSGVIPIKVIASFFDVNSAPKTIEQVFNVIVLSGPPTALSISYVSTSQDIDTAKFKEKMNVLLTDKYNNPVNSSPGLSVSLISGYHNDESGPLGYMFHSEGATIDTDKLKVPQGIVTKVEVNSSGFGYLKAPKVSLSGGDGNFDAQAVLTSKGSVYAVHLLNTGSGYTQEPQVSINGAGSGFSAIAELNTSNGTIQSITVSNGGDGYTVPPTVSGIGGTGLDATAVLKSTGTIKSYTVQNGGSNFNVGDQLKIWGDGFGAVIKVTKVDANGTITNDGLTIFNKGSGYTYANIDTTELEDGTDINDTSVRVDLTIGYSIDKVVVNDGGSGYTGTGINFSAEAGATPAIASAVLMYPLSRVTVQNGGYGYDGSSTITIEGDGTGAFAVADVRYYVDYISINNGGTGYVDKSAIIVDNNGSGGSGLSAQVRVFENFNSVDISNEYLGTFGDGYTYAASGKWDFNAIASNELTLTDTYEGNVTSGLGFAIGNNHRQDRCISGREWVCTAEIIGDPLFDANGLASFEVIYDYYMTAKDIVMMVNLVGAQNDINKTIRLGEAIKHTLRGNGIEAPEITIPGGVSYATYRIYITLQNTAEPLRNANFTYTVSATDGITIHSVTDSMDLGIDECGTDSNGNRLEGRAYVDITVSSIAVGTVKLENLVIAKEFK